MAMIRIFFLSLMAVISATNPLFSQDDVRQQIRAIKLDELYIKAEANDSVESEAVNAAALELIYNYNSDRMDRDLDTISVELIRPALQSLVYARGSIKRVLVFVELAVADSLLDVSSKNNKVEQIEVETPLAETIPVDQPEVEVVSISSSIGDLVMLLSNMEMVTEAVNLLSEYKDKRLISGFGQLRSLDNIPSQSYLLIYDRERTVRAILAPDNNEYYNVKRNCPDAITNYSGCGSLWFR